MVETKFLSGVWTHLTQIQPTKGKRIYLYDEEGKEYIDFTSGIGVVNTGHSHPKIVNKIKEEADKLLFAQMNCVISRNAAELSKKLNDITPENINQFFFASSGAEATEAAVKLARCATKKRNIIVFQGSFHGRTHLTMAMTTSKYIYRKNYQPLPSGVFVTPFPYSFQYGWSEKETIDFCLKQLDILLHSQTAADETAAIIIEPVLGEGGYVPVPDSFMYELRKICTKNNILLIADEIQSGFGRTGKFFCIDYSNIKPDIIIMAKGLGSGMPISAVGANKELMDKWTPGTHGGTYAGGNTLATAAAIATIDVMIEEKIPENSYKRGQQLLEGLNILRKKYDFIGDVRGRGLMIATEFVDKKDKPNSEIATKILQSCLKNNLLLLMCGTYSNIIRWIPPLIVNEDEINKALKIFEKAIIENV